MFPIASMPPGSPRSPRRRRLLGAGAAALLSPALAQGTGTGTATGITTAADRTVRVIGPWELSSLDPLRGGYLFARMQVAETLVDYDAQARPVAGLASRWQVSGDGLVWRFALRKGARFHDGSPVSARDVVNALRRALHPAGVLGQAPIAAIDAVTDAAIEAATDVQSGAVLQIRLRRPFPALPALLSHSSTQILAPASFGADGAVRAIVGSGPYRIVTLEPPQRFSVAAFDGWQGPAPAVRRASYLAVGRAEMRALMAEAGQAELAYGLDPGSVARLRRGDAVRVHQQPIPRTTALKLNAGHPLLACRARWIGAASRRRCCASRRWPPRSCSRPRWPAGLVPICRDSRTTPYAPVRCLPNSAGGPAPTACSRATASVSR
jgi:peptide/nickel transport system substrate-binding protein